MNNFRERCRKHYGELVLAQQHLREAQAEVLSDCIAQGLRSSFGLQHRFSKTMTIDEYRANVPIRDYTAFEPWIQHLRDGEESVLTEEDPTAFLKTSGTTGKSKAVPSTDHWRNKYRGPAIYAQWHTYVERCPSLFEPWAALDLTWDRRRAREFIRFRPYHAITHRSQAASSDDWIPPWFEAPWFNLEAETEDFDCRLYTRLRYFLGQPLRAIVTVNPSMLVLMATRLEEQAEQLIKDVHDGTVLGAGRPGLRADLELYRKLEKLRQQHGALTPKGVWPQLEMLACWRSGGAALYQTLLDELYPGTTSLPFMTTGTEGVVTIPTDGHLSASQLAVNQAFFEFAEETEVPLGETQCETRLAHELDIGGEYQLVMTQANGLYRYAVGDVYRVVDITQGVPRLEFERRAGVVFSFTGEKLMEGDIISAYLGGTADLGDRDGPPTSRSSLFTVVPIFAGLPYYAFFTERVIDEDRLGRVADEIDRRLRDCNEEYHAKRVSSRLAGVKLITVKPGTFGALRRLSSASSAIQTKHVLIQKDPNALTLLLNQSSGWSDRVAREELINPGNAPTLKRRTSMPPRSAFVPASAVSKPPPPVASLPRRSLHQTLSQHALDQPSAPALLAPGKEALSYAALVAIIERTAAAILGAGVVRGDRVALVMNNGADWASAYLSITSMTSCVPLSEKSTQNELVTFFRDLKVRALVTTSDQTKAIEAAKECGIRSIEVVPNSSSVAGEISVANAENVPARLDWAAPEDTATVLLTSGTTSASGKIIPLTHSQLLFFAHDIATMLELRPADRCLNVMPLFHSHGLFVAFLATLQSGGSVVCTGGFQYALDFLTWLETTEPTWYTAVPTIQEAILKTAKRSPDAVPKGKLRFIRSASSSLQPELSQALEETFASPVIETYGLTEFLGWIACNRPPPFVRKPGSVGTSAGREFRILDGDGKGVPVGEIGEVCVRAPELAIQPENAPPLEMPNGWFHTGDLGCVDREGYLFIRGRVKEVINRGGEKISPVEVDEVLRQHPAVSEVVTFGMPSRTHGEEVAAAVVLAGDARATEEELRNFAAAKLSQYKVPRRIVILESLPRTASGKVSRLKLAEFLGLS